jgi:hypothetical protein
MAEPKYSRPAFSSRSLRPGSLRAKPTYCIRVRSQIMPMMNSTVIADERSRTVMPSSVSRFSFIGKSRLRPKMGQRFADISSVSAGYAPRAKSVVFAGCKTPRAIARFTAESSANSDAVMMFACVPTPKSEGIPATAIST